MMAYWRERFTPGRFVPAAALLAMAATATSGGGAGDWAVRAGIALSLVAQFRLWDDLADRGRDRHAYPARILATAAAVSPFVAQAIAIAVLNLALVFAVDGRDAARVLLGLNAAAAAYYVFRPGHRTLGSDLVLLAKYPAFVLVLAGADPRPGRLVLALATTYAAACAFEVWHDASGPMRTMHP